MGVSIEFAPEAGRDVMEAAAWYEGRAVGLGDGFLSSLDATLQNMRRNPKAFPLFHGSYRRAFVRRFPYCVFFELAGATIKIYSVAHTSRHPSIVLERLP